MANVEIEPHLSPEQRFGYYFQTGYTNLSLEARKMEIKAAKELAEKFVKEIETEAKTEMIWWFIGSVAEDKYKPGTSDVDIVIMPKDKGMLDPKYLVKKMDEFKKYGTVFKKGRDISLIDAMLFTDTEFVQKIRDGYNAKNRELDKAALGKQTATAGQEDN